MKIIVPHPNAIQRTGQKLAAQPAVIRVIAPIMHHLDRVVLALTGGRQTAVGLSAGLPVVQVTMTGAKTGMQRTLPLVAIPDGARLLLIASNYGRAHHPGWYYNLRAHPQVTVIYRGQSAPYTACEVTGPERERAFALADAIYYGFALYRQRAAPRQIHVMALETEMHPEGLAPQQR